MTQKPVPSQRAFPDFQTTKVAPENEQSSNNDSVYIVARVVTKELGDEYEEPSQGL